MDTQTRHICTCCNYGIYFFLVLVSLLTSWEAYATPESKRLDPHGHPSSKKIGRSESAARWIPLLLEVQLNERLLPGIFHCYRDSSGRIWVNRDDLADWHLQLPVHAPMIYQQQKLYALDSNPHLHYEFDQYAMRLSIQAAAHAFALQRFDPYEQRLGALRPGDPGVFINYDGVALRGNHPGMNQNNLSALLGLGLFNRLGVGTANVLAYNRFSNDITTVNTQPKQLLRLDTTWTLDQPEAIASWRFGDAVTGATGWSGAARFAGVQYATNFSTQPNLITFPLPGYRGEASIPSTVDVFVNSVLNQQHMVDNGPYVFNNIPVVSGEGTVRIVTQDILGRSSSISFPYYASPLLLKPNLVSFSYEAGLLRNNYALNSNDYGHPLGVVTYQRGITDHLTLGTHAEVLSSQQTLGFSANYLIQQYGVASVAVAGGHHAPGEGALLALSFIRQGPQLSYGFNSTLMSPQYIQLGNQPSVPPPSVINQLFLGYSLEDYGSLSLSYTTVNARTGNRVNGIDTTPSARLLTGTYSRSFLKNVSLSIGFSGDIRHTQTQQAFIGLILAPDSTHILSNYASWQNHKVQDALRFSKPVPLGVGYGYDLVASNQSDHYAGADLTMQNEIGAYTARLGLGRGEASYELDVSGSAIYFAGHGFLARKLTNSFALVQVPNYADVDVFYQNQLMGHTDRDGDLLVTELLPYQENVLEIEPATLPLDTEILAVKRIVVPYLRSGVLAQFPIRHVQGVVAHLITTNGQFIPETAEVTLEGGDQHTPLIVGYEGELYLPDVRSGRTINGTVYWNGRLRHFTLNLPRSSEAIIEMGNVICY